jgi:VWFA-related protein
MVLLGGLVGLLSLNVTGQASRARQVLPPKSDEQQAKPTPPPTPSPTPSPTPVTVPTPAATGQTPPPKTEPEQETVIKISSNLVLVPVSITDASGQPVRHLTVEDFRIEEEGQSQQLVTLGEPGKTPVELALVFDASGSVRERFEFEQQAASRFLKGVLKPSDAASIFSIGLAPKMVHSRTVSLEEAAAGVMAIEPTKEMTAFFDSIVEAAHYLGNTAEPGNRRVLVVISDGEDNYSEHYQLRDARRELQRTDCLFYSINPSGPSIRLNKISLKGQENLVTLANETGGAAFLPDKLEDLEGVFRQIAAELQAQYLIGYYSTDERTNGAFRRITVRVPKRPDLRVRARQGYYAPKSAAP